MTFTTRFITRAIFTRSFLCRLSCAIWSGLLLVGVSHADIFLPAGLSPGDTYRIAFVSSVIRDAQSPNVNDYNSFVNSAANASGTLTEPLNTTWTAIASTATVDARDNTGTNPNVLTGVPIYLVDGTTQIAANNADLWDGTLISPLALDEFGNLLVSAFVWTGTSPSGVAEVYLGQASGRLGNTDFNNSFWVTYATTGSENASYFYGISAELTARVVPEPGTVVCLGLGALGLLGLSRTQRPCARK